MSTSNCTNGLHRMGLLAVAAIFLAFAAGCGEAECDDGQTLVNFEGEDQCFDNCDGDEDCADGFECDDGAGVCLPDGEEDNDNGDNDNNDNGDNDNNGEECDPVEACADYCYEERGRCLEEGCGLNDQLVEQEVELCEEGFETESFSISGCLDRAQLSDAACQDVVDETEDFADQECSGEEQTFLQCTGRLFISSFTDASDTVMDSCGCEPANTAESCETDGDCDEYGRGFCDDNDTCQAECYDWDGALDGFVFNDPTCAEGRGQCTQGACLNICQAREDCPKDDQGCLIVGTPIDESVVAATGACLEIDPEAEGFCFDEEDCADGEGCVEGNCTSECDEDEDCEYGPCGDENTCEITFSD